MSEIHKAFILGAGFGTRLKPLTERLPKPLVPYLHEPLIFQALRHCAHAGIDQFAINTHHLADCWDSIFPNQKFENSYISLFNEPELLETGGGIKNIESWIGDDPILIYNGDILTNIDLEGLIQAHQTSENLATLALFEQGPNCNVAVQGDQVIDMRHSLGINSGTHQFSGIYVIEPEILRLIPKNQKISIVPAFLELIKQGKLGAYVTYASQWQDLGTREEYLSAHLSTIGSEPDAIHPSAQIHPEAVIKNSYIGPNCVIAKGAKLSNTIVWPAASIAENTELDHCIVREHAEGHHHNEDL